MNKIKNNNKFNLLKTNKDLLKSFNQIILQGL
jgi:hypothetical protein